MPYLVQSDIKLSFVIDPPKFVLKSDSQMVKAILLSRGFIMADVWIRILNLNSQKNY